MERRKYQPPTFEIYGTLSDLTEHGNSAPGEDGIIYKNPPPEHEGSIPFKDK